MSILVQNRAGRLTQNAAERLVVQGQTVQTYVHLPELQVGEDTTMPVNVFIALEVCADVESHRDRGSNYLEDRVDGLHIGEAFLCDVLRAPVGGGYVVET